MNTKTELKHQTLNKLTFRKFKRFLFSKHGDQKSNVTVRSFV